MKPGHKKWADLVIQGMPPVEAYMLVYPSATKKTAQNQTGVFRKDPEISTYMAEKGRVIETAVNARFTEALIDAKVTALLTSEKKREVLAKIVDGSLMMQKTFVVNGKVKTVRCKPDFHDVMKAIELDNKMTGDNVLAKRNEIKKAEEVTKIVITEDRRTE